MTKLRPFKDVQLQWLRLLLLDTEISPRAFQFATYLTVWRYNNAAEKAWPSHSRVCQDLGLKSEKTIQRLIKELEGKWFDIKRGNGLKHSTEYVPTKATHLAAQDLRAKEEAGKTDNIVRLEAAKGRHFCPPTQSKMSRQPSQKCPPKKEQEKTKEKRARTPDLPNEGQSGQRLVFVPGGGGRLERDWDDCLRTFGIASVSRSLTEVRKEGRRGYMLPALGPAPQGSEQLQDQIRAIQGLIGSKVSAKRSSDAA